MCGLTAAQDFVGTTTIAMTHAANSRWGKRRVVPPATTSDSSPTRPPNPHKPRSISPAKKMVPPHPTQTVPPTQLLSSIVLNWCHPLSSSSQTVPPTNQTTLAPQRVPPIYLCGLVGRRLRCRYFGAAFH